MNDYVEKLDSLKRTAPDGSEYWMARDLQEPLGYEAWRNFTNAIEKAKTACESAGATSVNHFVATNKMVEIGSGAKRETDDWFLSRYACYLIAMNGDATKREVALAQTYFTVQTRRQEIDDQLGAEEHRRLLRERVRDGNKKLAKAAQQANVQKFGVFNDAGLKGLYSGLGVAEIKHRKGIPPSDDLLDCVDRAELAMHDFKNTQAEAKIFREGVQTEALAIQVHRKVAEGVRDAVRKNGGPMPEDLPAVENIRQIEKRRRLQGRQTTIKGFLDGEA